MNHVSNPTAAASRTARRLARAAAVVAFAGAAGAAQALSSEVVATGLTQPLFLTAPGGDNRLFVVEKGGLVKVIQNGVVQANPFLDLSQKVATDGERGLLGMAFDPNYARNGRVYVDYIDKTTLSTTIARYTVAAPGGGSADPGSAQTILSVAQPNYNNHKGGWIAFRPGDAANLFIATGDGGSSYDPSGNGQNPNTLLGKMLRIDVSGTGAGYTVPADNPFVGQAGTRPELWALGLRNPFRNSFDRQTGDLWIADVGQDTREEIDFEAATGKGGHNYGWRLREGTVATPGVGGTAPGLTDPVFDYAHTNAGGLGNSITGGYVYRGPGIAEAQGRYFFGDYVSNRVFSFEAGAGGVPGPLREDTAALLGGAGLSGIDSFGEDGFGRLYMVGINGTVVRMVPEPGSALMLALGLAFCRRVGAAAAAGRFRRRRAARLRTRLARSRIDRGATVIDASSAPPAARPLTLRPAGIADAALIADMHAKSRASAYRGLLPDDYLDDGVRIEVLATWPPKMQALAAGAGAALIAERDGTPIGFVCMLARDDKDSVLIDNLHLLPEHKGGGAGTAMLDAAQRWAAVRGANRLELLVLESNVAAIGFYEARGWQLAGREDDAMGGVNVVALRYVLPITLPKTIS